MNPADKLRNPMTILGVIFGGGVVLLFFVVLLFIHEVVSTYYRTHPKEDKLPYRDQITCLNGDNIIHWACVESVIVSGGVFIHQDSETGHTLIFQSGCIIERDSDCAKWDESKR